MIHASIIFAIWTVVVFASSTQPTTNPNGLTEDDERVIRTSLEAFARHEHGPKSWEANRTEVIVIRAILSSRNSTAQIAADTRRIPVWGALIEDFRDRNRESSGAKLPELEIPDVDLRFEPEAAAALDGGFYDRYPKAFCWVQTSYPGHSRTRKDALVRFDFGPSGHGATATFLLERQDDGKWNVTGVAICYYM